MSDIFLSYARVDEEQAEIFRELLEAEGWDVWWDQEIRVGEEWNDALEIALASAKVVTVLWTARSVGREFVRHEARFAAKQGKLFGVRLGHCKVPDGHAKLQMAELQGWRFEPYDDKFQNLLRSLEIRAPPSRREEVRSGFRRRFLGKNRQVGWPSPNGIAKQLHYLHFSVVANPGRRLPWYVAYNVDGSTLRPARQLRHRWTQDPLVDEVLQPNNKHFFRSGFDRGYLAARSLLSWGDERDARVAAVQASFWTNITPQHAVMNRKTYLAVERWEHDVARRLGRLIGFCGPVLTNDDPPFRDKEEGSGGFVAYNTFRIPGAFWKVVVAVNSEGRIACRPFLFDNFLADLELEGDGFAEPLSTPRLSENWRSPEVYSVDIPLIEKETRITFPDVVREAPQLAF